jgi:ATP-dependent Clp protease ATP-binding subunit ClpC
MKAGKKTLSPLDAWTERDLTEAAQSGKLQPSFCVDFICEQLFEIISSGKNPVLSGESGIGKTAILYEFIRKYGLEHDTSVLRNKRILQLSIQQRAAGLRKPDEQIGPEMQKLIAALVSAKDEVIPFFRDFHLAYTFNIEQQFQMLAFQFPFPILAEGEQCKINQMFEDTPELEQQYVVINLEEPPVETVKKMLGEWNLYQRDSFGYIFNDDALEEALILTHRFLSHDRLPRKAIDLLKQVAAFHSGSNPVTSQEVIERFCNLHRVPRFLVDPEIKLNVEEEVDAFFHRHILGQDEALQAIIQMIVLIKAGLSDMRRPFGVYLFAGPTGVGKTHLAQSLAEFLFGGRDRMIRLNMADYQTEYDAALLFGNPDAYSIVQKKGILTQRISGNPFAVILLDEFEKAHSNVHDRFLQLIDEGRFINGFGETIPCRSMIIIATTNEGAKIYRGQTMGFNPSAHSTQMDHEVDRCLERRFRFEFLNRFDRIVHFHPLSREHIRSIALREIAQLQDRVGMKSRKLKLEIDESVIDWITVHGFDPDYGARFLRRTIERQVTTTLADVIVRKDLAPGSSIILTVRRNNIAAVAQNKELANSKEIVTIPEGTGEKTIYCDVPTLLVHAQNLLERAAPLMTELERDRDELSGLIDCMNVPDFWSSEKKDEIIERFRSLDVTVRIGSRLAEAISQLDEMCQEPKDGTMSLPRLSRAFEKAAASLDEWHLRFADDGVRIAWMAIGNQDPLNTDPGWVEQIADLEMNWCRRLKLSVNVAAYCLQDDALSRVFLEIEGPGISSYCAMEQGIHRLKRKEQPDARVKVELIPRLSESDRETQNIQAIKRNKEYLDTEVSFKTRLQLPDKGVLIELFGGSESTLSQLCHDMKKSWLEHTDANNDTVRNYGKGGIVKDPRTGIASANSKDVYKGKLDRFLEGWKKEHGE